MYNLSHKKRQCFNSYGQLDERKHIIFGLTNGWLNINVLLCIYVCYVSLSAGPLTGRDGRAQGNHATILPLHDPSSFSL